MGEFQSAVQALLHTFTSGIDIIKKQRGNRRKEKVTLDPSRKAAESDLSRSLKKNRREVKTAYEKDASVVGSVFGVGDEEAHSSLASILLRLNAGFVAIIERFTKGRSSHADYQALINLSNSSRIEAVRTFEMLSKRISQSSLALDGQAGSARHKRKRKSGGGGGKKGGGKSAQSLTVTPLGVASAEGWVRSARKRSSEEGRGSRENKRVLGRQEVVGGNIPSKSLPSPSSTPLPRTRSPPSPQPKVVALNPPPYQRTVPTSTNQAQLRAEKHRKSIMSFASDSTKLGEIPEYKWMRPAMFENVAENGDVKFPVTTFYPMEPWQEPEKRRGMLRKLFRL